MTDSSNQLENIKALEKDQKAKGILLSPDPERRKFITELLHAFSKRKISFATLTGMDLKKLQQMTEIGHVKLKHGRYEHARKIFEILTFIDHKNYYHHLALGGAYQKLKKTVDAIFQYSQVLKLQPKHLNALVNRGELFLRRKNYRKAAEDFREAIVTDKSGKDLYANRARQLVIAIKRSMSKDKDDLTNPNSRQKISGRKKISPFKLMGNK